MALQRVAGLELESPAPRRHALGVRAWRSRPCETTRSPANSGTAVACIAPASGPQQLAASALAASTKRRQPLEQQSAAPARARGRRRSAPPRSRWCRRRSRGRATRPSWRGRASRRRPAWRRPASPSAARRRARVTPAALEQRARPRCPHTKRPGYRPDAAPATNRASRSRRRVARRRRSRIASHTASLMRSEARIQALRAARCARW